MGGKNEWILQSSIIHAAAHHADILLIIVNYESTHTFFFQCFNNKNVLFNLCFRGDFISRLFQFSSKNEYFSHTIARQIELKKLLCSVVAGSDSSARSLPANDVTPNHSET